MKILGLGQLLRGDDAAGLEVVRSWQAAERIEREVCSLV